MDGAWSFCTKFSMNKTFTLKALSLLLSDCTHNLLPLEKITTPLSFPPIGSRTPRKLKSRFKTDCSPFSHSYQHYCHATTAICHSCLVLMPSVQLPATDNKTSIMIKKQLASKSFQLRILGGLQKFYVGEKFDSTKEWSWAYLHTIWIADDEITAKRSMKWKINVVD